MPVRETAERMLSTHPRGAALDAAALVRCIEACHECAAACTLCADACLAEDDVAAQVRCIRRNLDCADLCVATARVVSRQTEWDPQVARPLLQACAAACRTCGDECAIHAEHGMDHCRVCAASCRACQEACERLLAVMG